ncbi:hypothetical protein ASPZODRAFT_165122 [Penicilliopsis zonata CBS 506.65]|uniref:Large ribosomal subunit protein mL54 n=1 Tax=Penicilliopsis zonata CBS 506.65 TaxID=1073090 RepID=A0A1L9SLZ4_9EURO|nr:hypothetical protein ASPZODRAFT_165122 [Penicilliopsis zonata CBS 506.65]OJJ48208.1 hypothetical protein ASPZODRAFT_165122 [Penicilliopsis zonata CBS 506.65]
MICNRCRTSILSRLQPAVRASSRLQLRSYSAPPTPRQPVVGGITIPSAIATPGASQQPPSSTPEGVSASGIPAEEVPAAVERPVSICPAGTKLNGLNYFKNKPDVLALEDSEYPEWLWELLDDASKKAKLTEGEIDPNTLNKKQRKRYERKLEAMKSDLPPPIPVHHYATDIIPDRTASPVAQAFQSLEKRAEITKGARAARRKSIREDNFLRGL